MHEQHHAQCLLRRGQAHQVAFVPESFARSGKTLKLKEGDSWVDGWLVVSVFSRMSSSALTERSRDYLRQRRYSDI
jgi:hypothetical protein